MITTYLMDNIVKDYTLHLIEVKNYTQLLLISFVIVNYERKQ